VCEKLWVHTLGQALSIIPIKFAEPSPIIRGISLTGHLFRSTESVGNNMPSKLTLVFGCRQYPIGSPSGCGALSIYSQSFNKRQW